MKTKTRKTPPSMRLDEPQERFPLATRPQRLERTAYRWMAGQPPLDDDFLEVKPDRLGVGDVIRATYYTTGLTIPPGAIHCSGAWGANTWIFEILRIERTRNGYDGYTAACNYFRPGQEPKAGIFFLSSYESYEVLAFADELERHPEPEVVHATVISSRPVRALLYDTNEENNAD